MRGNLIIALLFYTVTISAQFDISLGTSFGYESNINKSPNSFTENNILYKKEQLHLNSTFQDVFLDLKYAKKWKSNVLRASLSPEMRYYYSEPSSKITIINSRLKHTYFLSKKLKLESNLRYKIKDRKGADFEDIELRTPLGYNLFNLSSGIHFSLHKNNKTFTEFSYSKKNFDKSDIRKVEYNMYSLNIKYTNNLTTNNLNSTYGISLELHNRDYNINYFNENRNNYRNWIYINLSAFYEIPITNNWNLKPAFYYENRIDKTDNTFGYSQIKPSLSINYSNEKFSTNFRTDLYIRDFKNLQAFDSNNLNIDNLEYIYSKIITTSKYHLTNNSTLLLEAYYLDRKSNNTNINTQAYRSYTNYYIGTGFTYNF